jgi:hypothetical protein
MRFSALQREESCELVVVEFKVAPPSGTTETRLNVNKTEYSSDLKTFILNFLHQTTSYIDKGSFIESGILINLRLLY